MKLSREQELYLIDLGVAALLDSAMHDRASSNGNRAPIPDASIAAQVEAKHDRKRGWTPERRAKFMATLARNKRKRKSATA
jgi:hypothetical protein